MEAAVQKALGSGAKKIVIDLEQVTYIDSTGIGIVAFCFGKISKEGGTAVVSGAQGLVLEVFRITRLDSIIKFFPDADAACASLGAAGQSA